MRFTLIDRIDHIDRGRRLRAVKTLSLSEEYLADHFPRFAVMPGVFMLEALTQAATWLIHATDDFNDSLVVLQEARNLKFGDMVRPGDSLAVEVEIIGRDDRLTKAKCQGRVGERTAVSARLILKSTNATELKPEREPVDQRILRDKKKLFALLGGPAACVADAAAGASD